MLKNIIRKIVTDRQNDRHTRMKQYTPLLRRGGKQFKLVLKKKYSIGIYKMQFILAVGGKKVTTQNIYIYSYANNVQGITYHVFI